MLKMLEAVHEYAMRVELSLSQDFHDVMARLKGKAADEHAAEVAKAIELLQADGYTVTK